MASPWIAALSIVALTVGFASAAWSIVTEVRKPDRMPVMRPVWPINALYLGPIANVAQARLAGKQEKPFWQSVFVGVTHCGAGCTLGDIAAEWIFRGVPFATTLATDFAFAYIFGIAFQYFSIAPMRGISGLPGIWAAIKADTLSLTAFEIGLFAWMALAHFVFFHPPLDVHQPAYWFMMQIGMILGFGTAFPMNWWLIRRGIKEAM